MTAHPAPTIDATLTDRYVGAVLALIPSASRGDIEEELRAAIGDARDARLGAGDDPDTAEEGALVELGNPDRLAERYLGRPLALIGAGRYCEWRTLVRTLVAVVVPLVTAIVVVVAAIAGEPVATVIAGGVGAAFNVFVQVCFWTTLVYAVLERTGPAPSSAEWSPADLPPAPTGRRVTLGETVTSVTTAVLVVAAMLWQRSTPFVDVDGTAVPILEPDHWRTWWPFLIVVVLADAGVALWAHHRRRWSTGPAIASIILDVAFAAPVLWLLSTDSFFEPAFLAGLDWGDVSDPGATLSTIVAVSVVVVTAWSIGEVAWRTWRPDIARTVPQVSAPS